MYDKYRMRAVDSIQQSKLTAWNVELEIIVSFWPDLEEKASAHFKH